MELTIILTLAVLGLMLLLIMRRSAGVEEGENDEVSSVFVDDAEVPDEVVTKPDVEPSTVPEDRSPGRGKDTTSDDDLWSDDSLHLD